MDRLELLRVDIQSIFTIVELDYALTDGDTIVKKYSGSKKRFDLVDVTKTLGWCRYCNYPSSYEIKITAR